MKKESYSSKGFDLKDIILGGQDGLVNVLGVILGVAAATYDSKIIIIAGLAATFAESISMAAVAYTSTDAVLSYYTNKLKKTKLINLIEKEYENPKKSAFIVGLSALLGSIIPLIPFLFLSVKLGIIFSLILSGLALFLIGSIKGSLTKSNWFKSGIQILTIGMLAALAGYLIGYLFGNVNF